jgi:hypothetical protein
MVVDMEQRQWLLQAILALAPRGDPAAGRRHALTEIEVEPFHQSGGDLPAPPIRPVLSHPACRTPRGACSPRCASAGRT